MSVTTPPRRDGVRNPEIIEFMLVIRRALLLVVKWIEKNYII